MFYDIVVDSYFIIGLMIKIFCIIEFDGKIYFYVLIDVLSDLYLFYIGK